MNWQALGFDIIFETSASQLAMKYIYLALIVLIIYPCTAFAQKTNPKDLGFRQLTLMYQSDTVEVLIKSQKDAENIAKPLFLFCEGSLPQPLIKTDGAQVYGIYPFQIPDDLLSRFHLVIISKPFLPLLGDKKDLGPNFMVLNANGKVPPNYRKRNHPAYYLKRNMAILEQLSALDWVKKQPLVVAGHSQGSSVALLIAAHYPPVSHLIYSGGNPFGRIMSMIGQSRAIERDSLPQTDNTIAYWREVVKQSESLTEPERGDTYKATFDFSENLLDKLLQLEVPTLVSYGSRDFNAPFNDYLQIESIRQGKSHLSFKAYIGTEHNYFPLKPNGQPDYEVFNWDQVAKDWLDWIIENTDR